MIISSSGQKHQEKYFWNSVRGLRGFTLIEVLAVVVVMTLAGGTLLVLLGASDDVARVMRTKAAIRNMDARARLLARTSGTAVRVTFDVESNSLGVNQVGQDDEEIMTKIQLERPCVFRSLEGQSISHVVYDRAGTSQDFQAVIKLTSPHVVLNIAGLTGWISEETIQ